jgi:predicted Zn-dependent protease
MQLDRLEEAIVWLRRGIENNPNLPAAHFCLASALAQHGIIDQAQGAVKAGRALDPSFTIRRFRWGDASDNHLYSAQRERIIEGMRPEGVPEG